MAVSNTVQGLNNVVDLLKNILDTLKDDQKAVQPKDVSSTSKVTANKKSNDSKLSKSIDDINALNKLKKNVSEKAGSFVNVIKTLSSKEVLNGITRFALLSKTGIFAVFASGIDTMVNAINRIGRINVSNKKLKLFTTVLNTLKDVTKVFTDTLYSLAGIVVVAAAIGVFAVFAWPQILIGFAVITATMAGVILIIGLMSKFVTFLYGGGIKGKATGASDTIAGVKFATNVLLFQKVAEIFLYLAGIIVVAAAVGLLAQIAMPQIITGLLLIGAVCFLVMGLIMIMGKFANRLLGGAKGPGGGFGGLTKGAQQKGLELAIGIGAIAFTVMILYSLAFLVVLAAGVGLLAQHAWLQIFIGFGMIALMLVIIGGLVWLIGKIANSAKSVMTLKTAGMVALIGAMVVIFTITTFTVLMLALTTAAIDKAGGHKQVLYTAGIVVGIIVVMSVIAAALAGLAVLVTPVAMAAAAAVIFAIGYVINAIGNTINSIVDVLLKINDYKRAHNNEDPFEGAGMIGLKIGWFVSTLSIALVPAALTVGLIGGKINKIKKLVDMVSDFVNIISKFAGDGDSLRPILGYNDDGTPKLGQPINMQNVAKVISSSFSIFVGILSETIGKLSRKSAKTIKKYGKALNKIMDPVASFIEIATQENEKLNNADLIPKARNIASIMTAFTTEISRGMLEADNAARNSTWQQFKNLFTSGLFEIFHNRARRTREWAETGSAALDMLGNLGNLFDLLTMYTVSSDGKHLTYKKENGEEVVEDLDFTGYAALFKHIISCIEPINEEKITNIENLGTAFEDFEDIIIKNQEKNIKAIKEYTAAIKEMSLEFKNAANAIKDVNKLDMPEFKSGSATSKSSTSSAATASQTTAVASTPQQTNSINGSDIVDAIKEGLNGSILNVSFNDSIEEFTAELSIS